MRAWKIIFALAACYGGVCVYGTLRTHGIEPLQSLAIMLLFGYGLYNNLLDVKREFFK